MNGILDANEIILTKKEDFKFNGGTIKTKKITGTFKNSGGNLAIGENESSIGTSTLKSFLTGLSGTVTDLIRQHTQIVGDYIQEYGDVLISNLSLTISSTNESNNGKLIVTGTATVDGQLTIKKATNMTFKLNQAFNVIEASKINGSFATVSLPTLNPDLQWDLRKLYSTGTLSVAKAGTVPIKPTQAFVYPNPLIKSNKSGNIFYILNQSQAITVEIYNMFGKKLHESSYNSGANGGKSGNNLIQMPTSLIEQLQIGPYFILVHNKTQTVARGKFVIK